jgi:NADH:ubiquinone oxidoreductase subunit 6 (subunit J)
MFFLSSLSFELIFFKLTSLILYSLIAIIIWDVLNRHLLMEKVFSLILVFCLLAFWLLLNGLEFLPLIILLLYVGAIAVLFLFVVMIVNPDFIDLLNQKQQLITNLQQRDLSLSLLLSNLPSNSSSTLNISGNDQTYILINKILAGNVKEKDQSFINTLQSLGNIKSFQSLQSYKVIKSVVVSYYTSFFLGLLAGSFFGVVFSWHNYLGLKFLVTSFSVYKLMQIYPIHNLELAIENQLGVLHQYGVDQFSGLKLQFFFLNTYFEKKEVINIGLLLYTKYGMALLIIGVMLLVSMMGAILLTLRQTHLVKRQSIGLQSIRYNA